MRIVFSILLLSLAVILLCFYRMLEDQDKYSVEPVIIYNIDQDIAIQIYKAGYLSGHYRGFTKNSFDTSWVIDSTVFMHQFKMRSVPKVSTPIEKAL